MRRPLLIIDGHSFAHRAYLARSKSIRRSGDKGAGAILGFANFLLRFYESERPRAVIVGWDTLDKPLPTRGIGNLSVRPLLRRRARGAARGPSKVRDRLRFVSAKAAGYEAADFLAAAVAR